MQIVNIKQERDLGDDSIDFRGLVINSDLLIKKDLIAERTLAEIP